MIPSWLRAAGPLFEQYHGRYLLPALAVVLVAAHYASGRPQLRQLVGAGSLRATRRCLLVALVLLACVAGLVWVNFFHFHYGGYVNVYEFFHYYMGSKYASEVGYFELYHAALVADQETGGWYRPADGYLTDLRSHQYRRVDWVVDNAASIRARFSAERWQEFVGDVAFFQRRMGPQVWNRVLRDKGYNATPVWTMVVGGGLSNHVPTGDGTGLFGLALLDVALLLGAVLAVAWAFGSWPALLMTVLLGSSYLLAHAHMKGAFLRTDFAVALVLAVCLSKKGFPGTAGCLVGYSVLSRLFPAVFLFGPLAKLLWDLAPEMRAVLRRRARSRWLALVGVYGLVVALALWLLWRGLGTDVRELLVGRFGSPERLMALAWGVGLLLALIGTLALQAVRSGSIGGSRLRLLVGASVTIGALAALSVVYHGGVGVWSDFAGKMILHRGTPHIWNLGFETIVDASFDVDGIPEDRRTTTITADGRSLPGPVLSFDAVESRTGWRNAVRLAALLVGFFAVRRLADHDALAFGFVALFFLVAPTYYYYIVLLLPFLFFASRLERVAGALGTAYLFWIAIVGFWLYDRWDQYFPTYYWNAVMLLGLTLGMTAVAIREGLSAKRDPRDGQAAP